METTETKKSPESLAELAQAAAELAKHVERVIEAAERQEQFPGVPGPVSIREVSVIVDRMVADGANEYVSAFHGLTYAWMLALIPEIEPVLSLETRSYRRTVVLQSRHSGTYDRLEFVLPRLFDYVDDEWANRSPEVDA